MKKLPANWGIEQLRCIKNKPEQQLYEGINALGQYQIIRFQSYQPLRERLWQSLSGYALPHVGEVVTCCRIEGMLCVLERHYRGENLLDAVNGGRRMGKRPIFKTLLNITQDLETLYCQEGLLHLDIKPENFMIDAYGNVTLLDFGSAYSQIQDIDFNQVSQYGTPAYAAPERFSSPNAVGPPADLYSLTEVLKWWLSAEGIMDYTLWESIVHWQERRVDFAYQPSFGGSCQSAGRAVYGTFEQLLYQGLL